MVLSSSPAGGRPIPPQPEHIMCHRQGWPLDEAGWDGCQGDDWQGDDPPSPLLLLLPGFEKEEWNEEVWKRVLGLEPQRHSSPALFCSVPLFLLKPREQGWRQQLVHCSGRANFCSIEFVFRTYIPPFSTFNGIQGKNDLVAFSPQAPWNKMLPKTWRARV